MTIILVPEICPLVFADNPSDTAKSPAVSNYLLALIIFDRFLVDRDYTCLLIYLLVRDLSH